MITALLLSTALSSPLADEGQGLLDTAAAAGQFRVLLSAVERAGLMETIRDAESLTILAPTDEAFSQVPTDLLQGLLLPRNRDALVQVLSYHVIPGNRSAADLLQGGEIATLEGSPVRFALDGGRLQVNGVSITTNDLETQNGTIHVISQVLLPEDFDPNMDADNPSALIKLAIERGVPLFNNEQPAACAALYEVTARALLLLDIERLGARNAEVLRAGLDKAAGQGHPVQQAWTLRYALDAVWKDLRDDTVNATVSSGSDRTLFEFDQQREEGWRSVNDDVMGGISRGAYEQTGPSTGAFVGALSLENNGGFATIRSPARDLGLAGQDGLLIRVRGDGRTYSLSALQSDRRSEVRTFRRQFTTTGEWQEIRIPFAEMELSVMGRRFPGAVVDPAGIRSLSFSISDKNEAPFRLEIDWIRADAGPASSYPGSP